MFSQYLYQDEICFITVGILKTMWSSNWPEKLRLLDSTAFFSSVHRKTKTRLVARRKSDSHILYKEVTVEDERGVGEGDETIGRRRNDRKKTKRSKGAETIRYI